MAPAALAGGDDSSADSATKFERVEVTATAEPVGDGMMAAATCSGCYAWSAMDKQNAWPGVSVRAQTRNYASETIYKQNAHEALIAGSSCYSGDYKYTGGTGDQYYYQNGSLVNSGWKYGGHGWWTNANGHNWWNGGQHWAVSGAADICRQY